MHGKQILFTIVACSFSLTSTDGLKQKPSAPLKDTLQATLSSDLNELESIFGLPKSKPFNPLFPTGFLGINPSQPRPAPGSKPSIPKIPSTISKRKPIVLPNSAYNTVGVNPPLPLQLCGRRSLIFRDGPIFQRRKRANVVSAPKKDPIFPIAGGFDALRNSWPWMALLGSRENGKIRWFCDGVLINNQWVLTAAHCVERMTPSVIRLGEHDYTTDTDGGQIQDFGSSQPIFFPEYKLGVAYHDIALLKLSKPAKLTSSVRQVCLPWRVLTNVDLTGKEVTITGWGVLEYGGEHHPILQEARINVNRSSECNNSYKHLPQYKQNWPSGITSETTLCASAYGKDSCRGDSGGPAVYAIRGYYILAGIVSKGYGCANANYPGLYVNVNQEKYLKWIKAVAF